MGGKEIWDLTSKVFHENKTLKNIRNVIKNYKIAKKNEGDAYKFLPWCLQPKCYEMQYFHFNWSAALKMSFSKVNTFWICHQSFYEDECFHLTRKFTEIEITLQKKVSKKGQIVSLSALFSTIALLPLSAVCNLKFRGF